MVWNYHDDDLAAAGAPVKVRVAGIPQGVNRVMLQHYRIDETHSNSYTVWKGMGSPQSPTAEQYQRLKEAGQLELLSSPEWLDVERGEVTVAMELPRQATSLLKLSW
jgi:xylan 1,4-beta-xylosidase